eukprot:scaffold59617_cov79-Phaeocystis_antarctica.AAC.21
MPVAVPAPVPVPSPIRRAGYSSWPPSHIRLVLRSALRRIEFHRFLMALSVRPGKDLTISDHRLGDRRRRMSDPAWHSLVGSTILCCHCRLNRCGAPQE